MEKVLIVARTQMGSNVCIGGLLVSSNRSVRLIPEGRQNHLPDTELDSGQVWEIEYRELDNVSPPHVEDIIVTKQQYLGRIANLRETLIKRVPIWRGGLETLFDHTLTIGPKNCYVSKSDPIPNCSTGYWLPDRPLILNKEKSKPYYFVEYEHKMGNQTYKLVPSIPFVGFSTPTEQIPSGALVRVSLARWFLTYGEEKCYLQISGWYL